MEFDPHTFNYDDLLCPDCGGTGDCPDCDGEGCDECDWTGKCWNCLGYGVVDASVSMVDKICLKK